MQDTKWQGQDEGTAGLLTGSADYLTEVGTIDLYKLSIHCIVDTLFFL